MADKEITNNQLAVLIEKVGTDVKAVAEGHVVIRREMRQMEERLVEKIDFVDGKVEYLASEFRELKEKVGRIEEKLDAHLRVPRAA